MNNPRFPHTCVISRMQGDPQDGVLTSTQLYSGSCRKELNKFEDQHYSNSANTAQWIISLPISVKIKFGDVVNVVDGIADISGTISDWETTNISHYNSVGVYTEDSSGNKEILDGTTTVGMHIYVNVTKN